MDWNATAKYAGGGLVMGSLFALVVMGKLDAHEYEGIATAALAGIGVHAASARTSAKSSPPASP